MSGPRTVL